MSEDEDEDEDDDDGDSENSDDDDGDDQNVVNNNVGLTTQTEPNTNPNRTSTSTSEYTSESSGNVRGRRCVVVTHELFFNISDEIKGVLNVNVFDEIRKDFNGAFNVNVPTSIDIHTMYGWITLDVLAALLRLFQVDKERAVELFLSCVEYWGRTKMLRMQYTTNLVSHRDIIHENRSKEERTDSLFADKMLGASNELYATIHVPVQQKVQSNIEETAITISKLFLTKKFPIWNKDFRLYSADSLKSSKSGCGIVFRMIAQMLGGKAKLSFLGGD